MIGGTFNHLHAGHKYYIKQAFKKAENVTIHLSSDDHVAFLGKENVQPFNIRKEQLEKYVRSIKNGNQYKIVPITYSTQINDFCIQENDLDLVVAAEKKYVYRFRRLNQKRYKTLGKRYHVEKVKVITDQNGHKISAHTYKEPVIKRLICAIRKCSRLALHLPILIKHHT